MSWLKLPPLIESALTVLIYVVAGFGLAVVGAVIIASLKD